MILNITLVFLYDMLSLAAASLLTFPLIVAMVLIQEFIDLIMYDMLKMSRFNPRPYNSDLSICYRLMLY